VVAPVTILTSLMDISIGALIAFRRACAAGLIAGIVASLGYMLGAATADAGSVDRAARRAGQDRAGDRPDAGGIVDAG